MSFDLASLRQGTDVYSVEDASEGFVITRRPGADGAFDALARRLINDAGDRFAIFPRSDGHAGYESVFIIPLDEAAP